VRLIPLAIGGELTNNRAFGGGIRKAGRVEPTESQSKSWFVPQRSNLESAPPH
jgi:hypothetical protein